MRGKVHQNVHLEWHHQPGHLSISPGSMYSSRKQPINLVGLDIKACSLRGFLSGKWKRHLLSPPIKCNMSLIHGRTHHWGHKLEPMCFLWGVEDKSCEIMGLNPLYCDTARKLWNTKMTNFLISCTCYCVVEKMIMLLEKQNLYTAQRSFDYVNKPDWQLNLPTCATGDFIILLVDYL